MLKGTALASTITLYELTGIARLVNARTYQPVEAYLSAGVLYMVLTYIFLQAWQLFERRANRYLAAQG
jgi:polar amino acid transport system permease protein